MLEEEVPMSVAAASRLASPDIARLDPYKFMAVE